VLACEFEQSVGPVTHMVIISEAPLMRACLLAAQHMVPGFLYLSVNFHPS
jgi:hypothetical protein